MLMSCIIENLTLFWITDAPDDIRSLPAKRLFPPLMDHKPLTAPARATDPTKA